MPDSSIDGRIALLLAVGTGLVFIAMACIRFVARDQASASGP